MAERFRRELWCWSLSAKRYVLYTLDEAGEPIVVKASDHGLGHLLNPTDPDAPDQDWITTAWTLLLRRHLGLPVDAPSWLLLPALSRVTVSGPEVLAWFAGFNAGKPYAGQIKPANFLLIGHVDPLTDPDVLPVAPYASDPRKWLSSEWLNARTGLPITVTTTATDGLRRDRTVRIRTYADVLADYLAHPEAKSMGPNGRRVTAGTAGLLRRRPVQGVLPTVYVGKEGNRIEERMAGLFTDGDTYANVYVERATDDWATLVRPVLASLATKDLMAVTGLHRRTVERIVSGRAQPRAEHRGVLGAHAVEVAGAALGEWGLPIPRVDRARLYAYLSAWADHAPRCRGCGEPLTGRQIDWCGDRCRKQANPSG